MTYAPHRRLDTWHSRNDRTVARLVAEFHRPRLLPWDPPLTAEERASLVQRIDALEAADLKAEQRRERDTPLVHVPDPTDAEALARRLAEWRRREANREFWQASGQWDDEVEAEHEAEEAELRAAGLVAREAA